MSSVRRFDSTVVAPHDAGKFASACVISLLAMDDWQISQDADEALTELVGALPGPATELCVTIHRDRVEVAAHGADAEVSAVRYARRPFRTELECSAAC